MADKLFLIHGMGEHRDGWEAPVVELLDELYARYPRLARRPRSERFEIVPVEYDSVFRDIVERWRNDADTIGPLADAVGASDVTQLVGWLRNTTGFTWTHAADVLLYRLFFNVRQAVKLHVGRQILEVLQAKATSETWAVLGHSLGTAVAHDTLHMLFTGTLDGGAPSGFAPHQEKALLVMMVANTSRVLETGVDVLVDSTVQPGAATAADRGCLRYITARHHLDPFTIPRMFDPKGWPDPDSVEKGEYEYIQVSHIHAANVHALTHYLNNPDVHIPLFRALAYETAVTKAQADAAIDAFPRFGNLGGNGGGGGGFDLQGRLEDIAPAQSDTWKELRDIWDRYQQYREAVQVPGGGQ